EGKGKPKPAGKGKPEGKPAAKGKPAAGKGRGERRGGGLPPAVQTRGGVLRRCRRRDGDGAHFVHRLAILVAEAPWCQVSACSAAGLTHRGGPHDVSGRGVGRFVEAFRHVIASRFIFSMKSFWHGIRMAVP
ncbi:unnamed protein product, partial [Prorocentrum cordatum]